MATVSPPAKSVPPGVEVLPTPESIASRLRDVRRRIEAAGRDPDSLRIVAVTKGWTWEIVEAARSAGLPDVGENYAQELLAKAAARPQEVRWHFLGPVQRNKVKRLAPLVSSWHGIDRPVAADAVAAACPGVEVFVEVNLTGIPGRPGCRPEEVPALVEHCRNRSLDLSGLMTIAPEGDPAGARECFRWLAGSARQLGLRELSMGMSDDFETAIRFGATSVRVGSAVFGARARA
jgi:hypothetical protein